MSWLKLSGIDAVSATPYDLYVGDDIVQNLVIPEGVTSIRAYAFALCRSITSVVIPDEVTSIGIGAFGGTQLTSVIIPASVTEIGKGAFSECNSLTSAKFEETEGWSSLYPEIDLIQVMLSDPTTAAEVLLTGAWLHRAAE